MIDLSCSDKEGWPDPCLTEPLSAAAVSNEEGLLELNPSIGTSIKKKPKKLNKKERQEI